jgi:hypothetical protein
MLLSQGIIPFYHPRVSFHVIIPGYHPMLLSQGIIPFYHPRVSVHDIISGYHPMLSSQGIVPCYHPRLLPVPHVIISCCYPMLSSPVIISCYHLHFIIPYYHLFLLIPVYYPQVFVLVDKTASICRTSENLRHFLASDLNLAYCLVKGTNFLLFFVYGQINSLNKVFI